MPRGCRLEAMSDGAFTALGRATRIEGAENRGITLRQQRRSVRIFRRRLRSGMMSPLAYIA